MTAAQEVPLPEPEFGPEFGEVLQEDSLDYAPVAGSVSLARHRAGRLVTEWGRPSCPGRRRCS